METMMHDALVLSDDMIVYRQPSDGRTMQIDMAAVAAAEALIDEIRCVTPTKAPELLAAFTTAWRDLDKLITILSYQHVIAQNKAKAERARILIDEVPRIIKERDLANSKDVRDAIVEREQTVIAAEELVHQTHCVLELLKGKKDAIGMAYTAVKRCVGEGAYNMLRNTANPNLSGDSSAHAPSRTTEISPAPSKPRGFGTPRY